VPTKLDRARDKICRLAINLIDDTYACLPLHERLEQLNRAVTALENLERARRTQPGLHKRHTATDKVYYGSVRARTRRCKHDTVTRGPFVLCPRCGKKRPTKAG
jgi:hypothetical protein